MKKAIIYDVGASSYKYLRDIEERYQIIAVTDGYKKLEEWQGYRFIEPTQIRKY